ncbi:DUF5979 domain-containing protein [Glycomyces harbinensis]|uniref:LPXTG-motif cell wall anchor domain-containing protein n=1 Tax=Glycomyces harbinensis TaxID=58114 RepID=A0A1G6WSJ7_9ACTN|nr:DUF5979 domain-containing protein [Glycomyces harbinensis]SDD68852.1 LPXTG-motif cell wall anchor domain-containing protein [Glycomyces harbinensis]
MADALANGPANEPSTPELTVTPETMPAPDTGEIVGPFTVTADGSSTIRATGVEVFTDPEGANPLADGDTVAPGAELWARIIGPDDPHAFVLDLAAQHLVGTVYLYDGSNPGRDEAQKLVLAQSAEMTSRAGAELIPYTAGSLEITKRIEGPGAGLQDEIAISVSCTDPAGALDQERTLSVPAGSTAGDHLLAVDGLPAESECTITETADGGNDRVRAAETVIDPATVTIAAGATQTATVTNTYVRCAEDGEDAVAPGGCLESLAATGGATATAVTTAGVLVLMGTVLLFGIRRRTA